MLTATDIACSRGERRLFGGVNFALDRGEWLHIKGENGAGKTTLLRTLIGLSPADEGEVQWRGADTRRRADEFRRAFIYLGHASGLKDELTPIENLRLALAVDGFETDDQRLLEALHRMGLGGREELPSRVLSAGQKRRVLLARLLLRPADLWVLDEPFTALDAAGITLLCAMIGDHLALGGIVVLTSHQTMPLPRGRELVL
ncbi:MAG TPA: cytochrome c biogenesis heme-transporting ATPase CcmA [Albitalea sp.]|nr:cytochrome c biogenesis heme-transporting ATPase CcmA [Albitalea sp.]